MTAIKERPILFSAPMVRAILDGRKTVTRRPVKGSALKWLEEFVPEFVALSANELCPFGQIGDRLYVRETFNRTNPGGAEGVFYYRADGEFPKSIGGGKFTGAESWKPSIHMPREASRILLEITNVRVERLQDGEGETAFESRYVAEGINRTHQGDGENAFHPFKSEPGPGNWTDPFDAWRELWVSVNGSDSWNANPWVWVVEFKRVD
ncbi:hypothetical protein LOY49_12290 [Pseudomonas atacamensis]|uniref:hypothetical protein n=1 Tax=Pseudomonas atacamensis TaxID=2565368 RepID=UPI00215E01EC|nr:hypothetical protein [Pseudomonas atacamensis]UVK96062.1 hypothetical protein LOY49_12290 [Pseudomonas atacamensis]